MATSIEAQFFADIDANDRLGIDSEAVLWGWIDAGATVGLAADEWELVGGSGTYFRGQASAAYGLTSKLYRDLRMGADAAGIAEASESDLAQVERSLLESMRHEGLGRRMSDGDLLMVMQHHGIASRLMDVSATPKEALSFSRATSTPNKTDASSSLICEATAGLTTTLWNLRAWTTCLGKVRRGDSGTQTALGQLVSRWWRTVRSIRECAHKMGDS